MSSLRALRGTVFSAARLARQNSTAVGPSSTEVAARRLGLPPDKLRALIAIYHDCDTFITAETLDAHIDEEFVSPEEVIYDHVTEYKATQYMDELRDRRLEPKFGSTRSDGASARYGSKSVNYRTTGERETRVRAALFGTSLRTRKMPGLEIVLEEQERVRRLLREEKEEEAAGKV